jgi:hypothetical protein
MMTTLLYDIYFKEYNQQKKSNLPKKNSQN